MAWKELRNLNAKQWNAILACYLGWTLDAFDYFILIFVFPDIAQTFGVEHTSVTYAVWLTLAMRPVGAFLFGILADRFGRRPILMLDIICYSVLGFASGFVTSLAMLYLVRALFGIAMGGEWGVGASLTMETIPPATRGLISGLLQAGYPSGYLLASIVYALIFDHIGWRGMFMIGALPALLVLFIRSGVDESPAWLERKPNAKQIVLSVSRHFPLFIFVVLLMTAFNFYSHGTQDSYPAFLKVQHKFNSQIVGTITAIASIGAILGGLTFGQISQQIGRRKAIVIAALVSILVIPIWAFSQSPWILAVGAFFMQFLVQGAWGAIPAHLNELSPPEVRGTFPGFAYQLGNFFAAANLTIQAMLADHFGGNYGISMAIMSGLIAIAVAGFAGFGPQAKEVDFTNMPVTEAE
ncbi:MAG: MFS transporter [Verrucomicrobia bacterium]|nr:MFS transporter [Verrucomicrobiota bacterium]